MKKTVTELKEAFFMAVIKGKTTRVGKILDKHPEFVNETRGGVTPLQVAASYGQLGVAKRLLERGADVNAASKVKDNWTALHMAASELNAEMVALLLGRGADINAKSGDLRTPWGVAVAQTSEEEIDFFLSRNQGPTIIEKWSRRIYCRQKDMLKSLRPPSL